MPKLVITFPPSKPKNLGPLYTSPSDFLNDATGIHWEDLPEDSASDTAIAAPRSARFYHPKYSVPQSIMTHYTPSGQFTRQLAGEWIEKAGFARVGAAPALAKLVEAGYLKKIPKGRFEFLKAMDLTQRVNL